MNRHVSLNGPNGDQPRSRVSWVALDPDALGRNVASADYGTNGGAPLERPETPPAWNGAALLSLNRYNWRGDLFETVDPEQKVTVLEHDAAARLTITIENHLPDASGNDLNRTTFYTYNLDGNLTVLTASNLITGNQETRFVYGTTLGDSAVASFGLLRAKIYPDSDDTATPLGDGNDVVYDRVEYKYNRLGQPIAQKDQNGTVHDYRYDKLGRPLHDGAPVLGAGIDAAVRRISLGYDVRGLLQSVTSHAEADPAATEPPVNAVRLEYNALQKVIFDYQSHSGAVATETTPKVGCEYVGGAGNQTRLTQMTYPNGRVLSFLYGDAGSIPDLTGQVQQIKDGAQALAAYTRRGVKSTVQIDYDEPQIAMTYIKQGSEQPGDAGDQYTGLDRFNRIRDIRWLRPSTGGHFERVQYDFDRAGNRTVRRNMLAMGNAFDESYSYDGLYQLTGLSRGPSGTPSWEEQFTYDPTGNWLGYLTKANGTTTLDQIRLHNKANEIVAITNPSSAIAHDMAGNTVTMPKVGNWTASQQCTWDAWNRLVKVTEGANTIATYVYDGLTRRIWKETTENGGVTKRHFYYSDKWQILEERLGSSTSAERQFVWGARYIDDLILRDRFELPAASSSSEDGGFASSSSSGALSWPERLYALHDQWHVTGLCDRTGGGVERYAYSAFGDSTVLTASFDTRSLSLYEWETRFGAYRFDRESRLYYARYRYLHSLAGRWLGRDPLQLRDGSSLYNYANNAPSGGVDPTGEQTSALTEADCEQVKKHVLNRDPLGKRLYKKFAKKSCTPPEVECTCAPKEPLCEKFAGGYNPIEKRLFVCFDKAPDLGTLIETITHELIHAYDFDCLGMDPFNCEDRLCSEIHAYEAEGACRRGSPLRGTKTYRQCIADSAVASTIHQCPDAPTLVNKVLSRCLKEAEAY